MIAAACPRQPCPNLKPCPVHGAKRDARSASARGYGVAWRRVRVQVLREEPLCLGYPPGVHLGLHVRADSVDHIVPRSDGGTDARSNLRGLCGRCNSRKAVMEEGARPR